MKTFVIDVMRLIRTALVGHAAAFALWLTAELAVLALFHKWYRMDAATQLMNGSRFWGDGEYIVLMFLFAAVQGWYAMLLGWVFNLKRPASWLRTLPISPTSAFAAPALMIAANALFLAATMADLWFVHAILQGNSVALFLLVLPLFVFATVRAFRSLPVGAVTAAVIASVAFWSYNTAFVHWQGANSILVGELYFVAFLAGYMLLCDRRQWLPATVTALAVAAVPLTIASVPYVTAPTTFRATVVSLRYFPTAPAKATFQQFFATDHGWRSIEPFPYVQSTPDIGIAASAVAAQTLSDADSVRMAALVVERPELFELARARGEKTTFYPKPRMSAAVTAWLKAHWDDRPYSCALGREAFTAGFGFPLDMLMAGDCGKDVLLSYEFWFKYRPWNPGAFERDFERVILEAKTRMPAASRRMLYQKMLEHSAWGKKPDRRVELEDAWAAGGIDPDTLAMWRSQFMASERAAIRAHLTSKSNFVNWLKSFNTDYNAADEFNRYVVLQLVCEQVSDRCHDGFYDLGRMNPLELLAIKTYIGFTWERTIVWHIKREILNSPRLDDLLDLAKL